MSIRIAIQLRPPEVVLFSVLLLLINSNILGIRRLLSFSLARPFPWHSEAFTINLPAASGREADMPYVQHFVFA